MVRAHTRINLIDADGANLGVISSREALCKAQEMGLDLVLVSETCNTPPVCKIFDYRKLLYSLKKRKSTQKKDTVKCVQFSIRIDINDYRTKINRAISFLSKNHKVTLALRCRGREIASINTVGLEVINQAMNDLQAHGRADRAPKIDNKTVKVTLNPIKGTQDSH